MRTQYISSNSGRQSLGSIRRVARIALISMIVLGFAATDVRANPQLQAPDFQVELIERGIWGANHKSGRVVGVQVAGDRAYVGTSGGLTIFDVSNPAEPREKGAYDTELSALAVSGEHAYLATPAGLIVLDIADPAQSLKVGACCARDFNQITVSGKYAYLTWAEGGGDLTWNGGLEIVDISTPSNPRRVGGWVNNAPVDQVAVHGNYAFVRVAYRDFWVIDVKNPANPTVVGGFASSTTIPNTMTHIDGFAVAGNFAYMVGQFGEKFGNVRWGLHVFDISDPVSPRWVGYEIGGEHDVVISGDYAFVGPRIIDITIPSAPKRVGYTGVAGQVKAVSAGFAYVAGDEHFDQKSMVIVDVRNPKATPIVSGWETSPPPRYHDVALRGNYAYVAVGGELQVMDVSDALRPRRVGAVKVPDEAFRVTLAGNYAYVSYFGSECCPHADGFSVIDIADPANPKRLSDYPLERFHATPTIAGNHAYVPDFEKGLQIVDLSNPASPKFAGIYQMTSTGPLAVFGSYAYVPAGEDGLKILDVSNASNPQLAAEYKGEVKWAEGAFISGGYLFLSGRRGDEHSGFEILDLNEPLRPWRVGFYDQGSNPLNSGRPALGISRVVVSGRFAFVFEAWLTCNCAGGRQESLAVVDLADPSRPHRVGHYPHDLGSNSAGLAVMPEGLVYLATGGLSFKILEPVVQPWLKNRRVGDEIELSWSVGTAAFRVQQSASVSPDASWIDIDLVPSQMGNEFSVRLQRPSGNTFFRLIKP